MAGTYFFYDLETSGLDPKNDRIMQFAGQRTDTDLNPIGDPYNILIKLNDDTLPSPEATLVTGITPQQTLQDGITEAEFARLLIEEICLADTMTVGFNNIRFDDEFIRHLLWRNFYDPYEWCWKSGCSRWDLLDVVRITRALRPDGIEWPVLDGKPTNRLELLTKLNGIIHEDAHDALSDVDATIAVSRLIKNKHPQLFEYLLTIRDKKRVMELVNLSVPTPFVYTSGRYEDQYGKTTVAYPITPGLNNSVVVYDLRYDPSAFVDLSTAELRKKINASWQDRKKEGFVPLPVKELHVNRSPAVAPLSVLSLHDGWKRLDLDKESVDKHRQILADSTEFIKRIHTIYSEGRTYARSDDPECRLYDGFLEGQDRLMVETVRNASEHDLVNLLPTFQDNRLSDLFVHYKARSFPQTLSEDESVEWEQWRAGRIARQLPDFTKSLQKLVTETSEEEKQFILQELHLWAESILPADVYDRAEESEPRLT